MTLVVDRTSKPPSAKPVVVSVNGAVIPREAISREIQNHPADRPVHAWQDAARALVVRELLLQEARRLDIPCEPNADHIGRRETDEEALIRALVEREIETPEPDEAVCRRYYERNSRSFRSPDIYEASHILFAARADEQQSFALARIQAETVLNEIRRQPEKFHDLARIHSACSSGAKGGNLGQITADQTTPEFEQALFALKPGQLCASPVPTRYGFHIIRLDRKIEGRQLPYELVADAIAEHLREAVTRRATAQYIARLVSRADIIGIELEGAEAHRVN